VLKGNICRRDSSWLAAIKLKATAGNWNGKSLLKIARRTRLNRKSSVLSQTKPPVAGLDDENVLIQRW